MDNDNFGLEDENEELRMASLDGIEMANNVQRLTEDREKLSVDLADKVNTIKKLLDDNTMLQEKLRRAQEAAALMFSNQGFNSTLKGGGGNLSMSRAHPGDSMHLY